MVNNRISGCRGCGNTNSSYGCCESTNDAARNRCGTLGPFAAVDRDCISQAWAGGAIIGYASGIVPVALTSLAGGLVGVPFYIGMGTAVPGVMLANNTINLTGLVNEAITVPRNGSMTAISASFEVTVALAVVGETAVVNAQVYRAPAGSNMFSPTGVSVNLSPPLTSLITVGTTLTGSASFATPVSVAQGDRLLMVYTLSGTTLASAVTGTASAGISIDN
ncbi:exosporium glycoprotein BclB-related protein [Sporosarcina sp. BI001-red]|uniref:exosporium glycoprotein BclB-related protein n=1 Tax=Sporosarcina sp. BI001-red TaxID=2282866 RepID=UPI001F18DDB4|nr:exosporium glycoprotein BclB-related protein [Sporosarcina sp. BI001-red]